MGVGGLCEHFDYVYSKKLSLQTLQEGGTEVWGNWGGVSVCVLLTHLTKIPKKASSYSMQYPAPVCASSHTHVLSFL